MYFLLFLLNLLSSKAWLYKRDPSLLYRERDTFAIIIVADQRAQMRYEENLMNIRCYANRYRYALKITDTDSECKGGFFFRKHCTVRRILEGETWTWALILDADTAVVNFRRELPEFVSKDLSVVHGRRFHNNEVQAGAYFVRNDPFGRDYLKGWVEVEYGGFNADNGALHFYLLKLFSKDTPERVECLQKGQKSRSLSTYDEFLFCFNKLISGKDLSRVRILSNSEEKPNWIMIDTDRPQGRWTNSSFIHHAMKEPYALRGAPVCSEEYFAGGTDEWWVPEKEYLSLLHDFWRKRKRRKTGGNSFKHVTTRGHLGPLSEPDPKQVYLFLSG